uniref:Hexosyltransferase n=1 Tax=Ascaris lumbricoides TaxID=6252 RepID=A0A0M3IL79_ASCLU
MRRLATYLLCACCACALCTIIVVLSCSCEQSPPPIRYRASPRIQNSADERRASLPKTYLMIVIMTRANDSAVRAVIRDTWLKLSSKGVAVFRHIFPVGIANLSKRSLELLDEEQNLNGDLLLLDALIDDYANLARKTLMAIDAVCHMYNFDFLLKEIKKLLEQKVVKEKIKKLYLGGGYVLSHKLADFISRNKDLLKLYRYLDLYSSMLTAGRLCVKEYRTRGSYVYDWSVPPSMCCVRQNTSIWREGNLKMPPTPKRRLKNFASIRCSLKSDVGRGREQK